ncbi:MAG: hypothetical protein ABIK08_00165 [Pseudomonadota bacterium]
MHYSLYRPDGQTVRGKPMPSRSRQDLAGKRHCQPHDRQPRRPLKANALRTQTFFMTLHTRAVR